MKNRSKLLSGVLEIGKRLISKGSFKSPNLFKGIQLGGIGAIGTGLAQKLSSPQAQEIADKIVGETEKCINSGTELISLVKQVNDVSGPFMAWSLIVGGIVALVVGRLPKKGLEGAEGIIPKKREEEDDD